LENKNKSTNVRQWVLNMLIASIPIIGYLMLVKWSTSNDNPDKKNWAIATLIFLHIWLFLFVILMFAMWPLINNFLG
tara:strand:- start:20 stop:250 length:231 start_codon:yes stop_codon:yes gene_type:complete